MEWSMNMMRNTTSELYHHGILGQKWGKKNGPPYPLNPSDHSASEKKAGWQNSINKTNNDFYRESSKKIKQNSDGSLTVPKGFVFNRVGKNTMQIRTNETGGLFVSSGKADAARYIKIYGYDLVNTLFHNTREAIQHISVVESLRVPSESQTVSETGQYLKDHPDAVDALNEGLLGTLLTRETTKLSPENIEQMINNPDKLGSKQIAYIVNASLVLSDDYREFILGYYEHFKNSGFDAIPDLHDIYDGKSETAMVVINPNKLKVYETTVLTKDVYKAGKDYVKSLEKLPVSEVYKKL